MAQDFAKSRNKPGKTARKKPAGAATRNAAGDSSHWSWYFSGLFSGLLLCVIGYFTLQQMGGSGVLTDDTASTTVDDNRPGGTDLQFYEYLPQAEVEVNVVPVEIASPAEQEADLVTYWLQAASYLDPNEAESLRARIILMNLQARIQPTNLSGRTWYRVQAGPFVGRASVEAAENTLIQNNIDPIRMKIP